MTRPDDLEAVALAELDARVTARYKAVRAVAGADLTDGDKRTIRSPLDGSSLGSIYRTDPEPRWTVTDWAAFEAHVRSSIPDGVETAYRLHVPSLDEPVFLDPLDELAVILREHAPHMLREVPRIRGEVVADLLAASKTSGQPAAAGIEQVKPSGSVAVRRSKTCGPAIERLHAAGLLTWDGKPMLPLADEVAS